MKTDQRIGPSRVLLLNCGKFDFAAIELDAPLHLVGPNNVGKTSLIALLQLLYIDDQRQMHFARDMSETKRYYFPDVHSYALFECLTPTGFQVLGVHGRGPVRQYDFERFAYTGRLEPGDYLDADGHIREHNEIVRDFATRDFTRLEPRQLRAALTGVGDNRGVDLRLVPARHSGTYARFRKVFNNILRLSHLKQDELKQLLLDIFKGEFQQRTIDLADTYAQGFAKVQKDSRDVQELKQLQEDIEVLLKHIDRRDQCRRVLPALWQALGQTITAARADLTREKNTLQNRLVEIEQQMETATQTIATRGNQVAELASRIGELKERLARVETERERLKNFMPDWAEQRQRDLRTEIDGLAFRLGQLEQITAEQAEARLQRLESDIHRRRDRLDGLARAAVVWLRQRFEDAEIEDAFRVLDPSLLTLSIKGQRASGALTDAPRLEAALRAMLAMRKDGVWRGPGIDIDLAALPPATLAQYSDPQTIENELHDLEAQAALYRDALAAAHDAAELVKRKETLEEERAAIIRNLSDYRRLAEQETQEKAWRTELEEREGEQRQRAAERSECEAERLRLVSDGEHVRDRLNQVDHRWSELNRTIEGLEGPSEEWPVVPCDELPDGMEERVDRYRRLYADQYTQQGLVTELLNRIERRTYSRYVRGDEAATVAVLKEQLESIPEREKAVQELWTGIAVGIKKALSNIAHDLDTLKGLAQRLNQQIGQVSISNLTSLRVLIHERPDWARHIRGVSLNEDMPLFVDTQAVQQSFDDLGRLLSEHPHIDLQDLFDLQFEVGTPDEQVRRHAHLDAIESNGTTITIKVLVNLVLLRSLLEGADVRIPFYLDECSSLDHDNLAALVQAARDMGFVAVLASPDAMDAAERLYFIKEEETGRVVLDPTASLVRILRCEDASDV